MKGQLSVREDDGVKILVSDISPLKTNAQMKEEAAKTAPVSPSKREKAQEKEKRLYLRVSSLQSPVAREALDILALCKGTVPVVFYELESKKYILVKDKEIEPKDMLLGALRALLGAENVIIQ